MTRTFEAKPAKREATYLAFAVVGYSGSGKTKSMLRLADGMRRVKPGPTFVLDTNLRRSLHHADVHEFTAVHMTPPFSPDDYLDALTFCVKQGAARIIVDSMSDEHEGDGGVLEWHDAEIERMSKGDPSKALKVGQAAWKKPKDAHKRLRLWMWQQPVDWLLGYRAKDKQELKAGQQPISLGMQPIGGADIIYDLLFSVLLPPKGDGKPVWTAYDGNQLTHAEKQLVKQPGWFRSIFEQHPQLNEDIGEQLARWAAGGDVGAPRSASSTATPSRTVADELVAALEACRGDADALAAAKAQMKARWDGVPAGAERSRVNAAFKDADALVREAEAAETARQKANNE